MSLIKRGTFRISVNTGIPKSARVPTKVRGYIVDSKFGIHRETDKRWAEYGRWVVTHLATGFKLMSLAKFDEAKRFVGRLSKAKAVDWTFGRFGIQPSTRTKFYRAACPVVWRERDAVLLRKRRT